MKQWDYLQVSSTISLDILIVSSLYVNCLYLCQRAVDKEKMQREEGLETQCPPVPNIFCLRTKPAPPSPNKRKLERKHYSFMCYKHIWSLFPSTIPISLFLSLLPSSSFFLSPSPFFPPSSSSSYLPSSPEEVAEKASVFYLVD